MDCDSVQKRVKIEELTGVEEECVICSRSASREIAEYTVCSDECMRCLEKILDIVNHRRLEAVEELQS